MPIGSIYEFLESLGIKRDHIDSKVDKSLNMVMEIIKTNEFNVGPFLFRILHRFYLIDDYKLDGIACIGYDPVVRKITMRINPFLLWHGLLRTILQKEECPKNLIERGDHIVMESLKNGGWIPELFGEWIEFMFSFEKLDTKVKKSREEQTDPSLINLPIDNQFKVCLLSVVIHETLHSLWNHVQQRGVAHSSKDPDKKGGPGDLEKMQQHQLTNIAQDFSINQTLSFSYHNTTFMTVKNKGLMKLFKEGGAPLNKKKRGYSHPFDDSNDTCFDDTFYNQPYEYYYNLLKNCSQKSLAGFVIQNINYVFYSQGFFNGFGHDQFDKFNPMSAEAKKVACNDLKRVIDEMLDEGKINSPDEICDQSPFSINKYFAKVVDGLYKTDTVSWEHILRHYVYNVVGTDDYSYTMKRECRTVPEMFPGKERLDGLDLNIVMDVSGSICLGDYNRFINEIEKIARTVDHPYVRFLQFHSEVAMDAYVPLKRVRKLGIASTGGTCMAAPLELLKKEKNRKLTIVFTDGYVENEVKKDDYTYDIVLFLSSSANTWTANNLRERGFVVIHQDGENTWFK